MPISHADKPGLDLYVVLFDDSNDYVIALPELGTASGRYRLEDAAIDSAGVASGTYSVLVREGDDQDPDADDPIRGRGALPFEWSGSAELAQRADDRARDPIAKHSQAAALIAKLAGITSLADWLRALLREDSPDATALGEINDDGGDYDASTDSLEALRGAVDDLDADITGQIGGLTLNQREQIAAAYAAGRTALEGVGSGNKKLTFKHPDTEADVFSWTFNPQGERIETEVLV